MNNRFKFRFWRKNIEGKYVQERADLMSIDGRSEPYDNGEGGAVCYYPDCCICEQCTGLRDKDGQLIYENDYIENDNTKDDVYLVVFDEKTARFMAKEMNGNLRLINKNVRVVGNIHEKESK